MLSPFEYNEKCSQSEPCIYTLTLNTSNAFNSVELISENFEPCSESPSKDLVTWTPNESCSEVKHVYFIVPSEDAQFAQNDLKISPNLNNVSEQNQVLQLRNESLINFNKTALRNNSDTIYSGLFDYKISTPSEIVIDNKVDLNENVVEELLVNTNSGIPSFEDKILKRDSLLPSSYYDKNNKRKITCDKCKKELNSASQYYSHRNIHMQNGDKLSWFCAQCGEELKDRNALKSHELQKHGEIRMYPCPYCVYSSRKLLLLEYHIRNTHHGERKFDCKLCNKKFFRVHDLKMHLNVHLDLKDYICHLCGKQFNHSSNLIRHMRIHTKVKPFSCQICNKRFSQLSSMLAHQVTHTSGGKCPHCDAKYKSVSGLKKHVKSIHDRKISTKEINKVFYKSSESTKPKSRFFNCRICYERFRYKKGLRIHENTFHSNCAIPCKECFKIFLTIQDFKQHSCLKFKILDGVERNSSVYNCSVCLIECESYDKAECHICDPKSIKHIVPTNKSNDIGITVIPEINECADVVVLHFDPVDSNAQSSLEFVKSFYVNTTTHNQEKNLSSLDDVVIKKASTSKVDNPVCKSENKSITKYKNSSQPPENLIENKNRDSMGNIIYNCKYCEKEFTKKWNWSQHMGTHDSSMQKYSCQLCMKSFSYRSTYTNHLKVHSLTNNENEMYPCVHCPKAYKTKSALSHHVRRIHEKKENYFCSECKKGFYVKSDYSYHMRLHKKELIYICCFCGRKFSHLSHLRRHEKMHTGERTHKCPHCPKTFIQPATLRSHLRKHEDISGLLCGRRVEAYVNPLSKGIMVGENDDVESQKDFAVINLQEISDLDHYASQVPDDFAYVGVSATL